jgi:phospholipid/cholesterol/gamma-HCH transport system substrate-binding protein
MAPSRSVEVKVGIFVAICLATIAGLILRFGNIRPAHGGTYEIRVLFSHAAGLVPDTTVMYAGIRVGHVTGIKFDETHPGRVMVRLAIYKHVTIRKDAKFAIAQTGLLGDRLVEVMPQGTTAAPLRDGDTVEGTTSADMNELMSLVRDVLLGTKKAIERVDQTVARVDETILSALSLGHATNALANLDAVASNTVVLTHHLQGVVSENRDKVNAALTDLATASANFKATAQRADALLAQGSNVMARTDGLIAENEADIRRAIQNLAQGTQRVNAILARLEAGEGTAGKLLVDDSLYEELKQITDIVQRYGLFYNTWFGRKVRPGDLPSPAQGGATNTIHFGQDRRGD